MEKGTVKTPNGNDYVAVVYVTVRNDGGPGGILVSGEVAQPNVGRWVREQRVQLAPGASADVTLYFPEVEWLPNALAAIAPILTRSQSSSGGISYTVSAKPVR